jgi:hypothetical protein
MGIKNYIKKHKIYFTEEAIGFFQLFIVFLFVAVFFFSEKSSPLDEGYSFNFYANLFLVLSVLFFYWGITLFVKERSKWDNVIDLGEIKDCKSFIQKELQNKLIEERPARYGHDNYIYFEFDNDIYKIRSNISPEDPSGEVLLQSHYFTFLYSGNRITAKSLDNYTWKKDGLTHAPVFSYKEDKEDFIIKYRYQY